MLQLEVFEFLLRQDLAFQELVNAFITQCENESTSCCFPRQNDKPIARLRAAKTRILGTPYGPTEGLRLPPHGGPLLPGDRRPHAGPTGSWLEEIAQRLRDADGMAAGYPSSSGPGRPQALVRGIPILLSDMSGASPSSTPTSPPSSASPSAIASRTDTEAGPAAAAASGRSAVFSPPRRTTTLGYQVAVARHAAEPGTGPGSATHAMGGGSQQHSHGSWRVRRGG